MADLRPAKLVLKGGNWPGSWLRRIEWVKEGKVGNWPAIYYPWNQKKNKKRK